MKVFNIISKKTYFVFLLPIFIGGSLFTDDELFIEGYYSDNMVIQHGVEILLNGRDLPNQEISLIFNGLNLSTITDQAGLWNLTLPPLEPNIKNQTFIIKGSSTITYQDVLIGDVWLASGKSNMELTMCETDNWNKKRGSPENLRLLRIEKKHQLSLRL